MVKPKLMGMRLYRQYALLIGFIVLVPAITIGVTSYMSFTNEARSIVADVMEQLVKNIILQTDDLAYEANVLSIELVSDERVKEFVTYTPEDYQFRYEFGNYMSEKMKFEYIKMQNSLIEDLIIGGDTGVIYRSGEPGSAALDVEEVGDRLDQLALQLPESGELKIILNERSNSSDEEDVVSYISFVRRVMKKDEYKTSGTLVLDVNTADLMELWAGRNDSGSDIWLVNYDGKLLYHRNHSLIGKDIKDYLPEQNFVNVNNSVRFLHNGEEHLFISRTSEVTGWTVIASMPIAYLEAPITKIRRNIILLIVMVVLVTLSVGYYFTNTITAPLRQLADSMNEMGKGRWKNIAIKTPKNEIGELIVGFNKMNDRIAYLIDEVYKTEIRKQDAELSKRQAEFQALQMQINPHFLYNTLGAISTYAMEIEDENIERIVTLLSSMLRYAVQDPFESVLLSRELDHVRNFVEIQKIRSREIPSFEIDMEGCQNRHILRLTLQPIIENCFKYAFPLGVKSDSFIRISGEIILDGLLIRIEDNGVGLEYYKNRSNPSNKSMGIGLGNVDKRLKIAYGEAYGLTIESHKGTTVLIKVPLDNQIIDFK